MATVAYILLGHKDPGGIIAQARRLTAAGDCVAIHFDARSPRAEHDAIRAALSGDPRVTFAKRRLKCAWGSWSLVEATLVTLRAALTAFPQATHVYLLSGDCMPVKSAEYIHARLDAEDADWIESVDFFTGGWIKTGLREERLTYRHWFNERTQKWLFYASLDWQRRLGLARKVPKDLAIQIGSQWWCLRRRTVEALLDFVARRPDVTRFFRTTWIPDETFFQTLVRHLIPETEVQSRTLTFLLFSDYGMPVTFYNDHYDLLTSQDYLFARKISPDALDLKHRLGELYAAEGVTFRAAGEGPNLYRFLAGRGREGRRFGQRFWEREASLGRDRMLLIVTCKKWHVGKRLAARIGAETGLPAVDYLFDEEDTALPDLGGIETSRDKRTRHRKAVLRLLYDAFGTDALLICTDPARLDLLADVTADSAETRILDVGCSFSDDDLTGHARRMGLVGPDTPAATLAGLLPTIRQDISLEGDRLRNGGFANLWRLREDRDIDENAVALSGFLGIAEGKARLIAATPHLFRD
jgi:hypothetical protein